MLKTFELEEGPRNVTSGWLDGEGQGRWLTEQLERDQERWSDE